MSPSLVFITGSTGFIGTHLVAATLREGYRARLAVRKAAQVETLKALYPSSLDRLEFVVIPDLTNTKAIQAALDGVDYIFHLASPMPGKGDDFVTGYLNPAVDMTLATVEAAAATPSAKTVVIMSSILGLMPPGGMAIPGFLVKEEGRDPIVVDKNTTFPDGFAGHGIKYTFSKILAHQATVDWVKEHKPHFNVITEHPSFVIGPDMMQKDRHAAFANEILMNSILSGQPTIPSVFVDVRDVSDAVVRALKPPAKPDGRVTEVLVNGVPFGWGDIADFVKKQYPQVPVKLAPPFTEPFRVETTLAERELGIRWRPMEDILGTVLDQQVKYLAQPQL